MKNKGTGIMVGIVVAFVLLIAGIFVSTNNRAVSLEEQVFTADSDIQARRNAERISSTIWQIASRSTISMRQRLFLMSWKQEETMAAPRILRM